MRRLKLLYSSRVKEPAGCDLQKVKSLLDKLKEVEVSVEVIDTAMIEEEELHDLYISEAVPPARRKHYRIGHIFGTQKRAGIFFGRKQPALLLYQNGTDEPVDVFPHMTEGKMVSIEDFLEEELAFLEQES